MSGNVARVFVSATTDDLQECRLAVCDVLRNHLLPIDQEHFAPTHLGLPESLRKKIIEADAVICLIGKTFGSAPTNKDSPPRSYTQLEYDLACDLKKPVFVFMTADAFAPPRQVQAPPAAVEAQRCHRESVKKNQACKLFSSVAELREQVALAIPSILELAGIRQAAFKPRTFFLHTQALPAFVSGRQQEIQDLHEALKPESPAVVAVLGLGGQGKTVLVRQVVKELDQQLPYPFATGFWCSAYRGGFSFDAFLDGILGYLLKAEFEKRQYKSLSERSDLLLHTLQREPILVVIDGMEQWLRGWASRAHDPQAAATVEQRRGQTLELDAFLEAVSGLTNGTHFVVTSRSMPAALDHVARTVVPVREPGEITGLEGLDDVAAVDLLRGKGVRGSDEVLLELAKRFANHPLALDVLAGFLVQREGGRAH